MEKLTIYNVPASLADKRLPNGEPLPLDIIREMKAKLDADGVHYQTIAEKQIQDRTNAKIKSLWDKGVHIV